MENKNYISSDWFRLLFQKTQPYSLLSDVEIDKIGILFNDYLHETFKSDEQRITKILPISMMDVVFNDWNTTRVHGFHHALAYHFDYFMKHLTMRENAKNEQKNQNP